MEHAQESQLFSPQSCVHELLDELEVEVEEQLVQEQCDDDCGGKVQQILRNARKDDGHTVQMFLVSLSSLDQVKTQCSMEK